MAVINKERPIWFTPASMLPFSRAQIVEIRPKPVRQGVLPDWMGDESSGMPIAELEEKIEKKRQQTNSQKRFEIIDVSQLSDEDFTFSLKQIRPSGKNSR